MSNSATKSFANNPWRRQDFDFFEMITLRWADNDAYGHINNAHYYSFFDTAVDGFLLGNDLRKYLTDPFQTLVVASECRYHSQVSAPGNIQVGVRVGRVGNSSISYEVAVFTKDSDLAAAQGQFVHVCVERATQRPTSLPENFRRALANLPKSPQN
ncbi:acyl-CoA thioesterase [Orrella sp. NBD-18]|uniref:Acyl-CoA thioesterase n=1 Tax=Sheuella amnicola TaxID=2707330 RepID=A0A6B2R3R5_9BURK|nr:thioesterase family protein [Sheuella amnicola]NDY84364.1 acyl-CoA thioesterase [Sheuella amnicola]